MDSSVTFTKKVLRIVMCKNGEPDVERLFLDTSTMERWMFLMRKSGYEIRGLIDNLHLLF
jgi:hypothetical protein